ncbi:hypothetical protein [Novosphingobium sp. PhB165]|uniref:hypothetical protein n=1 Tax=Novosphingobium sp. PhB165 TaxID=2485105 RepID=UPI00104763AE|nr:hypothetical protein [Novosphingobium sp. PhB165]
MKREIGSGVILGITAQIISVCGLLIGFWQFQHAESQRLQVEHRLNLERDSIEFKRKLWTNRLDSYREIADLVGAIVISDSPAARRNAIQNFRRNYWGLSILAEDDLVRKQMIAFNLEISDFQSGWSNEDRIKQRADALLQACSTSIKQGGTKVR